MGYSTSSVNQSRLFLSDFCSSLHRLGCLNEVHFSFYLGILNFYKKENDIREVLQWFEFLELL